MDLMKFLHLVHKVLKSKWDIRVIILSDYWVNVGWLSSNYIKWLSSKCPVIIE